MFTSCIFDLNLSVFSKSLAHRPGYVQRFNLAIKDGRRKKNNLLAYQKSMNRWSNTRVNVLDCSNINTLLKILKKRLL